jgi:hypothetical protein
VAKTETAKTRHDYDPVKTAIILMPLIASAMSTGGLFVPGNGNQPIASSHRFLHQLADPYRPRQLNQTTNARQIK